MFQFAAAVVTDGLRWPSSRMVRCVCSSSVPFSVCCLVSHVLGGSQLPRLAGYHCEEGRRALALLLPHPLLVPKLAEVEGLGRPSIEIPALAR